MSLFDVPGVQAEIQDGGLRIMPPALNPKVTILGVTNRLEVAVNEPYVLSSSDDISKFDLLDGSPSELSMAISEAYNGGADTVEAVIISNTTGIDAETRYTALDAAYAILLNTAVDVIRPAGIAIDTPVETGVGGEVRNFAYQLANFCYDATINQNTAKGMIGVEPPIGNITGVPTLAQISAWVTALSNFDTSGIQGRAFTEYDGVTDANGDGVPDNYAFYATSDGKIPTGSPPRDAATVVEDSRGNPVDIGAYISVPAMHVYTNSATAARLYPTLGYYFHDGAAAYAGLNVSLPYYIGTTNQSLPSSIPGRNMSLSQLETLRLARFVGLATKPSGFRVLDGITGAYNISEYYRSDFVNLSTVDIVHECINLVRAVADPFLSKNNNETNRNSLDNEIDEAIASMQAIGALNDYEFGIISTASMQVLGQVVIDVKLDVALEIKSIKIKIGLTKPGTLGE